MATVKQLSPWLSRTRSGLVLFICASTAPVLPGHSGIVRDHRLAGVPAVTGDLVVIATRSCQFPDAAVLQRVQVVCLKAKTLAFAPHQARDLCECWT